MIPEGAVQRRYPRVQVLIDCQVEGTSGRAPTRLSELSLGGCYVDTRTQFSVGASVTIYAAFPAGDVVLSGHVLYVQPTYGFGVGFDDLPDTTRQQLHAFVAQVGCA